MDDVGGGAGVSGGDGGGGTAEGGEPKVKRKMKSTFQLETLEKTYAGLFVSLFILICFLVFNLLKFVT